MSSLSLRRLHDDDGISLVEIMVAIVILGVAMASFAATIVQALDTITGDEQFVRGNQVAADVLEEVRGMPWDCIGLDPADADYTATGDGGEATADIDTSGCTGDAHTSRPRATADDRTVDGQLYEVTRSITWVDDPSVAGTQDHKQIVARLDWTVRGEAFTTSASTTRVPTASEVPVGFVPPGPCVPGEIISYDVSPTSAGITPSGLTNEAISVVVDMCSPATTVTLNPAPLATRNLTQVSGSGGLSWQASFPVGTPNFAAGNYSWVINTSGTAGSDTATQTMTFFEEAVLAELLIKSFALDKNLCVSNGNPKALYQATTITVVVQGLSSGTAGAGSVSWTSANKTLSASYVGLSGTDSVWRVVMPASTTVLSGNSTSISATFSRYEDNAIATATMATQNVQRTNNSGNCVYPWTP